jgi:hypothetical protein
MLVVATVMTRAWTTSADPPSDAKMRRPPGVDRGENSEPGENAHPRNQRLTSAIREPSTGSLSGFAVRKFAHALALLQRGLEPRQNVADAYAVGLQQSRKYFASSIDAGPSPSEYCSMRSLWTWRRPPTRAIMAGAVAFLVVLQGLVLAASPALAKHAGGSAGHSISASHVARHCGAPSDDSVPRQGRHDHSPCCIFCNANVRDATLFVITTSMAVVSYSPSAASAFIVGFSTDDSRKRLMGWRSSWSSRAPPSV